LEAFLGPRLIDLYPQYEQSPEDFLVDDSKLYVGDSQLPIYTEDNRVAVRIWCFGDEKTVEQLEAVGLDVYDTQDGSVYGMLEVDRLADLGSVTGVQHAMAISGGPASVLSDGKPDPGSPQWGFYSTVGDTLYDLYTDYQASPEDFAADRSKLYVDDGDVYVLVGTVRGEDADFIKQLESIGMTIDSVDIAVGVWGRLPIDQLDDLAEVDSVLFVGTGDPPKDAELTQPEGPAPVDDAPPADETPGNQSGDSDILYSTDGTPAVQKTILPGSFMDYFVPVDELGEPDENGVIFAGWGPEGRLGTETLRIRPMPINCGKGVV